MTAPPDEPDEAVKICSSRMNPMARCGRDPKEKQKCEETEVVRWNWTGPVDYPAIKLAKNHEEPERQEGLLKSQGSHPSID